MRAYSTADDLKGNHNHLLMSEESPCSLFLFIAYNRITIQQHILVTA